MTIDIIGKRFGLYLTTGKDPANPSNVMAACDCGNIRSVNKSSLLRGRSASCGCTKLMKWGPKIHRTLTLMKYRCHNPNSPDYHRYGGRGIRVCERWLNNVDAFAADMGLPPSDKHTIDRKDTNGNYEPSNCRWATRKQQSRNRRCNHLLILNNKEKTIAEWSEITGIKYTTIRERIKRGWSPEKALTTAPL